MMPDKIAELYNEEKAKAWVQPFIFSCALVLMICLVCMPFYLRRNRVEQGVMKFTVCDCMLFYTTVWVNHEIVQQWTTPAELMTDSIKNAQKIQGERILHAIK